MNNSQQPNREFLEHEHYKIRISDLGELLLSRIILFKASDAFSNELETVNFQLTDLFPDFQSNKNLSQYLENKVIKRSDKPSELAADFISALTGQSINAVTTQQSIVDYYNAHFTRRLEIMRDGDNTEFKECIENFTVCKDNKLFTYKVSIRPKTMAQILSNNIRFLLELPNKLWGIIKGKTTNSMPRIDYRKQLEFLIKYLDSRKEITGERNYSFNIKEVNFRYSMAIYSLPNGEFSMLTPGTTEISDKLLLPLFLEINGIIDISAIVLDNRPEILNDIGVIFSINKPPIKNIYNIIFQGLATNLRNKMTESEQVVYDDIYSKLKKAYIYGGRPNLEKSFAELCCWLIKKISFCLEDPSFIKKKAFKWLEAHKNDNKVEIENDFFHPEIHEKLKDEFGDRIIQKPDKFGGYVDFFFDSVIPIELKVRQKSHSLFNESFVIKNFKHGGQAAAYATVSRIAFVLILDLPFDKEKLTNLNNCYRIFEKRFKENEDFPTCIIALVFHCHHPRPSSAKM